MEFLRSQGVFLLLSLVIIALISGVACQRAFSNNENIYVWGISASKGELHLGHIKSLMFAADQAQGSTLLIGLEDRTAGLDPFGSPARVTQEDINLQRHNANAIIKKISFLLRDEKVNLQFVRQSASSPSQAELNYTSYCDLSNVEGEQCKRAYVKVNYETYRSYLEPHKRKNIIIVAGEDQRASKEYIKKMLNHYNISLNIHPLVIDKATNQKIGKRNNNANWVTVGM